MCTRFVSSTDRDMEYDWSLIRPPFEFSSIEVRLTTQVPIVYQNEDGRVCESMRWGLIPFWFKDDKWQAATWNARVETIAEKPSYRGPWRNGNRCLFPIRGFYEWQAVEGQKRKQRWFIRLSAEPMAIAGLWDANNKHGLSAAMLTMPANELMKRIHNAGKNKHRMPLFIAPENYEAWLTDEQDVADELIKPYPSARMEAWPVPSNVAPGDLLKP